MSCVPPGQELTCTFCRKSRRDAKKLILSPDKQTSICDECALEPARLNVLVEKPEGEQITAPALFFRVRALFRNGWGGPPAKRFQCSFCGKKKRPSDVCVPHSQEDQAQICKDCLAVCRQILVDEFKQDSTAALTKR
jgi:ATP-dependent protease Clp ATPase subunit